MFVIVAGRHDHAAKTLLARWTDKKAGLLTCDDLSVAGWRHYLAHDRVSTAVIGGTVVNVNEIEGVVSRLPYVPEDELTMISSPDRSFVASEMHAFLVSWLSSLECPVLNPPTPACLNGPNWRQEKWLHVAAKLGIPVLWTHHRWGETSPIGATSMNQTHVTVVTVVGDRSLGFADESLKMHAQELADQADVDLLRVWFNGSERGSSMVATDLWADVADPVIADAMLEHFEVRNAEKKGAKK
jgi:hypothetical protein